MSEIEKLRRVIADATAELWNLEAASITRIDDEVMRDVAKELASARKAFPRPSVTAHEAYSILKEEVDELWEEVRCSQGLRIAKNLENEAIQVAAMAIRFVTDIVHGGRHNE